MDMVFMSAVVFFILGLSVAKGHMSVCHSHKPRLNGGYAERGCKNLGLYFFYKKNLKT